MSTVKISELPVLTDLDSNTANTILVAVDLPTTTTGKITLTTLANELYSNNTLAVGNNYTLLPNVVGQFTGNSTNYIQVNLQNLTGNGSGDMVVTADVGTDSDYFIDMGINGSVYDFPGYTMAKPLDGYLIVQGSNSSPTNIGGNLVIGTTTTGKDITITQGTFDDSGQVAKFVYDTGFKLLKKPLFFADGTSQNSAVDYATVNSRITANTQALNASVTGNVNTLNASITSNISTQNTFAQAAFNKANAAIANTDSVITAGDFYISSDGFVNGTFTLANSNFSSAQAAMTIKATANTAVPANDGYMLHISGKNNVASRIVSDSYGTGVYSLLAGRSARGTVDAPTATQNNDVLMRVSSGGWGTTGFAPLGSGRIDFVATENYTDSTRGSAIKFYNVRNGTNTINEIASFNADTVVFTGTVSPEKGFIFVPRVLAGSQTAITIDYANNSTIKASFNSTVTLSHANYTPGKIVEVWLTNTAGNGQTVNFGTLANNSTTGATALTVASGRSAYLKFFSIHDDQSNNFVAVTYA